MKKILIAAVAALFCFTSCMESVEDYIYTLVLEYDGSNEIISSADPQGKELIKEFQDAIAAYRDKNTSSWRWVETIYDGQTSNADAAARTKYDKYNAEVKSLMDMYQAKFDELPDNGSLYEANYTFKLLRFLGSDEVISSAKYNISYGN